MSICLAPVSLSWSPGGGGGEWAVLAETLGGGVCGPLPKTLTAFMTRICVFCYPADMT